MQKLNEMVPNMTHVHPTLIQRRLLVLGSSLVVLWFWLEGGLTMWLRISIPAGFGIWLFGPAALISFLCQYRLYRMNATRIASASNSEVDERQKMVRDQTYRLAYRMLIWILAITLPVLVIPIFLYHFLVPGITLSYIGLLWLMLLLPTWIVAWTERDN